MGFSSVSLRCSFFFFLFFFTSSSSAAVAVVVAYMRTAGAFQSGCRALSDEDHVPLCLAIVDMWRCITGWENERDCGGSAVAFTNGLKGRKSTVILR